MIYKIIIMFLLTVSLGMNISNHGKERKPNNAWHSFIIYLIWIFLLTKAGLF